MFTHVNITLDVSGNIEYPILRMEDVSPKPAFDMCWFGQVMPSVGEGILRFI